VLWRDLFACVCAVRVCKKRDKCPVLWVGLFCTSKGQGPCLEENVGPEERRN